MAIQDRIRERLDVLGMTQYTLAQQSSTTEACVSMIMTGKRSPHLKTLIGFCRVLMCSADYLLELKDNPNDQPNNSPMPVVRDCARSRRTI